MSAILRLQAAQRLILAHCPRLPAEYLPLVELAGRISAQAIKAPWPVPAFARSTMDGYAVHSRDLRAQPVVLPVCGEIAAGTTTLPRLSPGQAIRIMTGGALPKGADQVIPCECCCTETGLIQTSQPPRPGACIRPTGCDLRRGATILQTGETVRPQHLPILAESGIKAAAVGAIPQMAIICTGSELVGGQTVPLTGQIIGGNRFLLSALLKEAGAMPLDCGVVTDTLDQIVDRIATALAGPAHGLLTTGGMGPGKYDLLPRAFAALGIAPLYQSLAVRPGRATMFGLYRGKPVFALPGPPPAVFLLFCELVQPALAKLSGCRRPLSPLVTAQLTEPIHLRQSGILNLRGGVIEVAEAMIRVRPTGHNEVAETIIHIPANRRRLEAGEMVRVRPVRQW